ncbi:MAG TPA: DUF1360 domain-containing protein [Bacillales bacterium]|nr:DUF1360 domain-containing protein [Bacillales bacterium]
MGNGSWLDFLVLILASFRLTHLVVYDDITAFLRKPFLTIHEETDEAGNVSERVEVKGSGLKNWLGRLLACHWCAGVWSGACLVLLYWFVPQMYPLLLILAVAGAAAIIESRL